MFTGIVQQLGVLECVDSHGEDARLLVDVNGWQADNLNIGDSIAVNGACLSVVACTAGNFAADVSQETLRLTTLGALQPGSKVNLERPLTLATPLGGHLMLGHVDGVGRVEEMAKEARSMCLKISVPQNLARYIASKGSISVDGVSLTVNAVEEALFTVNVIPHTLEQTLIQDYHVGSVVNIEVDILARYMERLVNISGLP